MKYQLLRDELATRGTVVEMTFDEVADLVEGLPDSAFKYSAWWSNEVDGGHVQARAWSAAGFRVDRLDLAGRKVRFRRVTHPARD
jgi:hypothetical protein